MTCRNNVTRDTKCALLLLRVIGNKYRLLLLATLKAQLSAEINLYLIGTDGLLLTLTSSMDVSFARN
jgi:hypothetical protein